MPWGIAEWYGHDLRSMTPHERHDAALLALATKEKGMSEVEQPICPFLATVRPDARCNKVGGVCSIRDYGPNKKSRIPDVQPAAVCPNRFLEVYGDESIFAYIAREFFGVSSGAKVIKEVPFLNTTDAQGVQRSAKAGRIDWLVVPRPPAAGDNSRMDWIAVETQAVYFSGTNIWDDIRPYLDTPDTLHYPAGNRRPDYRSSGAKRLAPQLSAKSPVMRTWGRKVVVVVDES